ncbi:MAG: hypothetical protein FJ279_02375 [Planctomycetes bacterium]|nr:hypothetical protein [Planctomycetota bacterium]
MAGEKREFVRIPVKIPVRYWFVNRVSDARSPEILDGETTNVGGGGLMLVGRIPDLGWIPDLTTERIVIGVSLGLPGHHITVVEALTRAAWVQVADQDQKKCILGLHFREMTSHDRDAVFQYVIRARRP